MSLSSQYRLSVWVCLTLMIWLEPAGVTSCQALGDTVPKPQLSQSDPAYTQLMNVLELVGHARHAVAENLSHANVAAYKRKRVRFTALDSISVTRDVRPADLAHTGRPLDWAIKGAGWFQLTLPDGRIGYTRCGTFMLSPEGSITSEHGFELEPAISLPADYQTLVVGRDGVVSCFENNGEFLSLGVIQLARFTSDEALKDHGHGVYLESAMSGWPVIGTSGETGFGSVQSGFLENSNVNVLEEQHLLEDLNRYESQLFQAINQLRQRSSVPTETPTQPTGFEVPLGMLQMGFEFRDRIEQRLKEKAEDMLFAIVGAQRAKVSIAAELDLNFSCVTTETPLAGHPTMKEEDVIKENTVSGETGSGDRGDGIKSSASTTVNYAVGEAVEKRVSVPGHVVGLSVAVLIDLRDPTVKDNRMLMSIEDVDQLIRAGLGLRPSDALVVKQVTLVSP